MEVVFGTRVQARLKSTLDLEPLYLWGEHEGLQVQIEWESAHNSKILARILVFAQHPQHFLNGWWAGKDAVRQDHSLFVAGRLAGITTDKFFYQSRTWKPKREHHFRIYQRRSLPVVTRRKYQGRKIEQGHARRVRRPRTTKISFTSKSAPTSFGTFYFSNSATQIVCRRGSSKTMSLAALASSTSLRTCRSGSKRKTSPSFVVSERTA